MIRPGTCTPPRLPGMSTPTLLHRNGNGDDALADSWVDVGNVLSSYASGFSSSNQSVHTSGLATPPMNFVSEEYLKLLREAQRESNQSSAIMSLASSRRDSLHGSPGCKSPPNSPNTELSLSCEDLRGVFINGREEVPKDWIWDWSSRPDMVPPKEWKFTHPKKHGMSMRNAKVGNQSLFSKEVLYTLLLTNMLSICLGATIGLWLSFRRSRWLTTAGSM